MRKQRSHMDVIGSNLRQRFESKLPLFDEKAPDLRNHAHAYSWFQQSHFMQFLESKIIFIFSNYYYYI